MTCHPQIEDFPDQYWMNCVGESGYDFPRPNSNGMTGLRLHSGVNMHWPSQQGRAGRKIYTVCVVAGSEQFWAGTFFDNQTAAWMAKLLRAGRVYADPGWKDSMTHYVCVAESEERIPPVYARRPYFNSFDPMI